MPNDQYLGDSEQYLDVDEQYLGDGVYVAMRRGKAVLSTRRWRCTINTIVLEPKIVESLIQYLESNCNEKQYYGLGPSCRST
jgi:hypothetical protein